MTPEERTVTENQIKELPNDVEKYVHQESDRIIPEHEIKSFPEKVATFVKEKDAATNNVSPEKDHLEKNFGMSTEEMSEKWTEIKTHIAEAKSHESARARSSIPDQRKK